MNMDPSDTSVDDSSIVVMATKDATYLPERWQFQLDQDEIFQRLIADIYSTPNTFLRELIQNALDATRCRMYAEIAAEGRPIPEYPTHAPEETRERFPIRVSLREEVVLDPLSGGSQVAHILTVEDQGIGMDTEIIRRYLLQVGRSYYTTEEFRRAFRFHPTSRFGVGFLSVFAVSDHITVETLRLGSKEGAVRLQLTGPRSYILTERGHRTVPGTSVEVRLRQPLDGQVIDWVRNWCVFAEFPTVVNDRGQEKIIRAEKLEDHAIEYQHPLKPNLAYALRVYPANCPGVEGGFVALSRTENGRERWVDQHSLFSRKELPIFEKIPRSVHALHGVMVDEPWPGGYLIGRLDIRRSADVPLARNESRWMNSIPGLETRLEEIVLAHLGPDEGVFDNDDWLYRIKLYTSDQLGMLAFWSRRRDMIPVWQNGEFGTTSLDILHRQTRHFLSAKTPNGSSVDEKHLSTALPADAFLVSANTFKSTHRSIRSTQAHSFEVVGIHHLGNILVAELRPLSVQVHEMHEATAVLVDMPSCSFDVGRFGYTSIGWVFLNTARDFGAWYRRLAVFAEQDDDAQDFEKHLCYDLWWNIASRHEERLGIWNHSLDPSSELACPNLSPTFWRGVKQS